MPNGRPGDHPYTDIIAHELDIWGEEVSGLVRELDGMADRPMQDFLADLLFFCGPAPQPPGRGDARHDTQIKQFGELLGKLKAALRNRA